MAARRPNFSIAGLAGVGGGLVGISCCVSPIVLYLIGVATATEAVALGNTLYYEYGWYFRAAGLLVGGAAVYIYLRRRGECTLEGARANRATIGVAVLLGLGTYAVLYAFTTWLGSKAPPPN